ncbi:phage holin family protein [Pseudomonas sp. F1_0610]|uniref:phage holin family protein n=1 Tax=Pseudomonas sp. F1_0610 TaxID=3114284 RepID=UPI0039C24BC0
MNDEQQLLHDIPIIILILVAAAGMAGELRQADIPGLTVGEILKRVLLRWSSSALFGVSTLMIAQELGGKLMLSAALGMIVGLLGADIAGAIYTRVIAKKAGVKYEQRQD